MTVSKREPDFERTVRQYRRLVAHQARRYLSDPTSADDVAQEGFLSLWQCRQPPASAHHLRNWLCRAARNRAISRNRRVALLERGGWGRETATQQRRREE